jgi:hypothetical protein
MNYDPLRQMVLRFFNDVMQPHPGAIASSAAQVQEPYLLHYCISSRRIVLSNRSSHYFSFLFGDQ